jgi:hypothetical protein
MFRVTTAEASASPTLPSSSSSRYNTDLGVLPFKHPYLSPAARRLIHLVKSTVQAQRHGRRTPVWPP